MGGDFVSLGEAVEALNTKGVEGPTTFLLMKGRYEEQVRISNVQGSGRDNPIVIASEDDDPSSVTIFFQHTGSIGIDEHVIRVDTTDFVTLRALTLENPGEIYGTGVRLSGSRNIQLEDLVVAVTPEPLFQQPLNSCIFLHDSPEVTIVGCRLTGGYTGVTALGLNDSSLTREIIIRDCSASNGVPGAGGAGAVVRDYRNVTIQGLTIEQKDGNGLSLDGVHGRIRVTGNRILLQPVRFGVGISTFDCHGDPEPALFANNVVAVIDGDTLTSCVGMNFSDVTKLDLLHNSVHLSNGNTDRFQSTGNVTVSFGGFGSDSLRIYNNIFTNLRGREVITYPLGNVVWESNNNNLYTTGDIFGRLPSGNLGSIDDVRRTAGMELHSFSSPPCYSARDDLRTHSPLLDGSGTPFGAVMTDIDGNPRDPVAPDIGAYEFDFAPNGLAGTYTVGDGGDYATLAQALEDLHTRCIEGAVDFELLPGEHRGRQSIDSVPGVSVENRITLRSSPGQRETTFVTHQALYFTDHLLRLRNSQHVDISRLRIRTLDTLFSTAAIRLTGSPEDIRISENTFENGPDGNSPPHTTFIYSDDETSPAGIAIDGNEFIGGFSGVQMQTCFGFGCDTIPPTTGTRIVDNTFRISDTSRQFRAAITLSHHFGPVIDGNRIRSIGTGINLLEVSGPVRVTNNMVDVRGTNFSASTATGIRLVFPDLTAPFGLIANNMVRARDPVYLPDASSQLIGLDLGQSKNLFVVYNTIVVEDSASTSLPLSIPFGTDSVVVYNNILANYSGGPALRIKFIERFFRDFGIDHNQYFTTGDTIAIWNDTGRTDLASIRSILGTDINSLIGEPEFESEDDFHIATTNPGVNRGFAFRTLIIDDTDYADRLAFDIDGEIRGLEVSDIGADEVDVVGAREEKTAGERKSGLQVRRIAPGVLGLMTGIQRGESFCVQLMDINGRKVYDSGERTATGGEQAVRCEFPAGAYVVRIVSGTIDVAELIIWY